MNALLLLSPASESIRVCGLSLAERARRVARRAGAVHVVEWVDGVGVAPPHDAPLLVLRASDQLVHAPLVAGLAEHDAVAVDTAGEYAGAMLVAAPQIAAAVSMLTDAGGDARVARWLEAHGAARITAQGVARATCRSRADVPAATKHLLSILVKPQDNWITRTLYRPVSRPLTRLLAHTGITPNQVSWLVAGLTAIGLFFAASPEPRRVLIGMAVILVSSYVDCCDGEIARLKLLSSRFGAWLDTIVDELATVGTVIALGLHAHGRFGAAGVWDHWLTLTVAGACGALMAVYVVYFNLLVVVGSANSQDYVAKASVREIGPGRSTLVPDGTSKLAVKTPSKYPALAWLIEAVPHVGRRDFLVWAGLGFALAWRAHWFFAAFAVGSVVMGSVLFLDHVRLRRQLAAIARRGHTFVRT